MGKEFKVIKEVATVTATLVELVAVNRLICAEIEAPDFRAEYATLLQDIVDTYSVMVQTLSPLVELNDAGVFVQQFSSVFDQYAADYQPALSRPRINAEETFQKYLQFRKRKETKTSYPPLSAAFSRLHDFIDKWIDNDIWLAMSIDTALKMTYLVLKEVKTELPRDGASAFELYRGCIGGLAPYLAMLRDGIAALESGTV